MSTPVDLRCASAVNPLGVGEAAPLLSWRLETARRGAMQRAYRLQVDTWDSGWVDSRATEVPYAGPALASRQRVTWRVGVRDDAGEEAWSAPAWWEMGLADGDFTGPWMADPAQDAATNPHPATYFRRTLTVRPSLVHARAYLTARGVYELWLDGARATDDLFRPGWTDYRTRLYVQAYDLGALPPGEHTVGVILGEGWYCGRVGWKGHRNFYGDWPEIYAQIELTYADGTQETIIGDAAWRCAQGPLVASGFLLGETYDARLEEPGGVFPSAGWAIPTFLPRDDVPFQHAVYPPVRAMHALTPREITEVEPGAYLFDLGQNMVGRVRLRVSGPAGTHVTLRHGEMRYPDGRIYLENLRFADQTDHYILRGDGEEVYEPTFTFHGFRFIEVRGLPAPPTAETLTGVVLRSAIDETGTFACSHPLVNRLWENIRWGQRGNFLEVPTDCPQRDERLGWMGDGQIFARTACYNMDLAAFYGKWMTDINDAQGADGAFSHVAPDIMPVSLEDAAARNFTWDMVYAGMAAWGDAGVIVPWVTYQMYGDRALLARCYPHMRAWIAYLTSQSVDGIAPARGFGDWLSIDADTPLDLLATAYEAHVADLTARTAALLGYDDEAQALRARYAVVRDAFARAFIADDGTLTGDTQTGYALALCFGLVPDGLTEAVGRRLADNVRAHGNHLTSGFVGIGYLLPALTAAGHLDLAYALLEQETFPGWLYSVKQGATTIWERWDGWTHDRGFQDPSMNSFNHYSLGSVGEWLYATVAGLAPLAPGWDEIEIAPRPGGSLTWAEGRYRSRHGEVAVRWERGEDGLALDVTVPPNTTALVRFPTDDPVRVTGDAAATVIDGTAACRVGSGTYRFVVK
jgi:alpha-L-rhamnosidase